MIESPVIENLALESFLDKVRALRDQRFRLVQVSATRLAEGVEITYSFELDGRLHHLRLMLAGEAPHLPSISGIFPCVLLYENEIHDLFNVTVEGMAVDFHGKLYQTAIKFPFGSTKPPPATAPPPATTPSAVGTKA